MNTRNRFSPGKALRPGVVVPALVLIATAIAMAGCNYNPGGSAYTRSPSPGSPASDPTAAPTATSTTTPIFIELQGQRIAGELDGSATSASLLAQLPLTLAFRDHGGQEKLSQLPAPLDLEGAPEGSEAAPLTIGYYAPAQSLVLYYRHVGYFNGIVPIGTYENTDAIENQMHGFAATIGKAD
ncbi:cyclophilin-like fold protein [Arthrobacter sp. LAR12-1-1.1]|uniref:cyclophilin-like fold protein n=1 Tax=Arthrobacter sp. LAR12-1-1.1 TaxID=3135215 RepID=UPI0034302C46